MKQTPEELKLIKLYLELPVVADVIESDKKKIANSNIIMKEELLKHFNQIQDNIIKETYITKQELKLEGIRIIEETKTDSHIEALYRFNGYQHKITLLWSKARADVMLILAEQMNVKVEEE